MKNILAFLLLCWTSIAFAQNAAKFTLSGTITDGTTGETLIGATVKSTNGDGAISNEYGFYSLTLPSGQYSFSVAYLGYGTATYNVNLSQNQQLNITLSEQTIVLGAVEINARKSDESISQPDTITVEMRNIDRTTYKYFLALDASNRNGPNASVPANPDNNFGGACLGYFSAHTVQRRTLIVQ